MKDPLDLSKKEKVFQAQPRFSIVYLLFLKRKIGFIQLKELLGLTPGNLDHHLKKLEDSGIVKTRRVLSWRPLVIVEITPEGVGIFREYVVKLKTLLKDIPPYIGVNCAISSIISCVDLYVNSSYPNRAAISPIIHQSGLLLPGGSIALFTRSIRRSVFVYVPSFSA